MNIKKYLWVLKSMLEKLNSVDNVDLNKIVLVVDNCWFHRSKFVRKEIKRLGVLRLFIPYYSPELNPWEKWSTILSHL